MRHIKCFRKRGFEIWVEDFKHERELVCTAVDEDSATFVGWSLSSFHRVSLLEWDEI